MTLSHDPYVPSDSKMPEFTLKAVLLGIFFGLLFGATTTYLALKVGLTVSASIPIAVLAISLFKKLGSSTILENNIVQTIGSAGESIAAGVAFTLPALVFLSTGQEYFNYFQIFVLSLAGGLLGVLFMVPLRKALIVEEHGKLPYPEGVACADILIAGEKGGKLASLVYLGIFISVLYKGLMSIGGFWKEIPQYIFSKRSSLPNATLMVEVTPELLGVGYIIGIRVAATMFAGGFLSFFVLTPLITYFGTEIPHVLAPGHKLISEMGPMEIWSKYIRYIGAGAVTFGGVITMLRTLPTIVKTVKGTLKAIKSKKEGKKAEVSRLEKDLPISFVLIGSCVLVLAMVAIPQIPVTWFSSILVVIAGFFFVSVSSRIVGLIGISSNPISGMTIATLMGICLLFLSQGWSGDLYQPIALCVGAIVAIAAANAGATSQDLKTGFLIGATPIKQQIGIMIGVIASALAVGFTMTLLSSYLGFGEVTEAHPHPLPAPQAMLMATIVKGLFSQNLPWNLVLIGMGIAAVVELLGVNSLPFAVGTYLPLSTSAPIFIGGCMKWLVTKKKKIQPEDEELESGALFSSGLIAGGALMGIVIACLLGTMRMVGGKPVPVMDLINTHFGESLGVAGDLLAIGCFGALSALLYFFATRKEESTV